MSGSTCRGARSALARPLSWLTILAVFLAARAMAQPDPSTAVQAGKTGDIDRAAVATLIRQLEDDQFIVRRDATQKLGQAGLAAVEPLAKAAAGDSLETAFRALDALAKLSFSPDPAVEDAAFEAMANLASSTHRTANRAKLSLANLRLHYQQRAKDRLQELGASFQGASRVDDEIIIGGGGGAAIVVRGGRVVGGSDMYFANSVTIGEGWKGTPRDLRLLARLAGLDQVLLSGPSVTDEWLAELKNLTSANVRHIELRKTKVTDKGIAHLANLKTLTNVDIMYTPVTDAAIDSLVSLPDLRNLRMYGTSITDTGAETLQAKLPNARIDRRRGALLGVGGSITGQPCIINTVQEGSAAAKAGIQVDDIILQFDGKSVQNFTELTAAISEKTGGEKVEVVLLRPTPEPEAALPAPDKPEAARPEAAKPLRVTVTLGEW